jgi:DNA-binding transcriptional ArsR family regulator
LHTTGRGRNGDRYAGLSLLVERADRRPGASTPSAALAPEGVAVTPDWDVVGYVISSDHRTLVLGRLHEGPATPTQIASDVDLAATHVSRALKSLRERGLVELLVPEDRRKGRVYGITSKGSETWDVIQAQDLAE